MSDQATPPAWGTVRKHAAEFVAKYEGSFVLGWGDPTTAVFAKDLVAALDELERQALVIEAVARRTDSMAPGDIRRLLRPFRREPYSQMDSHALDRALKSLKGGEG